jgi:hypothetical protein
MSSLYNLFSKLKGGEGSGRYPKGSGASNTIGMSAGEYVRSGVGYPKKIPVGTRLELNDKSVLIVDRSNGYVISGTDNKNKFKNIDLRNEDAKILDDLRSLGTQQSLL